MSVPAVTIDDVMEEQHLGRVDFMKMDIEGGEVDALRGAEETLKKFTPDWPSRSIIALMICRISSSSYYRLAQTTGCICLTSHQG